MKTNARNSILLTCFLFSLASCIKMVFNKMGVLDEAVSMKLITNGEKKLVFLPMHHVGRKGFYEDAKHKIDSLISDGYVLYYENVRTPPDLDSLNKDTLYRKSRKITGVDFSTMKANQGYIDTVNGTFMGKKAGFINRYQLVNQGKGMLPLKDSLRVKNVDANFPQLIAACEKKFGPVKLTQYDYETKFGEKYNSKKNNELFNYFAFGFRNRLITDSILNSSQKKIAMIYGSLHFDGILENLIAADKNYKQVNSF